MMRSTCFKMLDNIVISLQGDRWWLELAEWPHVRYKNVQSVYWTPKLIWPTWDCVRTILNFLKSRKMSDGRSKPEYQWSQPGDVLIAVEAKWWEFRNSYTIVSTVCMFNHFREKKLNCFRNLIPVVLMMFPLWEHFSWFSCLLFWDILQFFEGFSWSYMG